MTITSKWSQLVSGRSILGKTVIFSTFSTIPHFRGSPKNVIQKYYQWTPNGLKHAHNWFLGSRFWAKHLVKLSPFFDFYPSSEGNGTYGCRTSMRPVPNDSELSN